MLTIVMRDKSLTCTTTAPIYQYDNNIDQIRCLVPCTYEGSCLKDATITLIYKDENGYGGKLELVIHDDLFNDNYHQFFNKINSEISRFVGKITVLLKIDDCENNFNFNTGETSFTILPCKELPKSTDLQQQTYFDQWLVKMTQIQNSTLKLQRDIINQSNTSRKEIEKLTQEVIQLKGGEINGN